MAQGQGDTAQGHRDMAQGQRDGGSMAHERKGMAQCR